jgi:3-methyl-2-oxobutanoate hydroxymethyltransferase
LNPTLRMSQELKKITTHTLLNLKKKAEKISMITAYDFSFAKIFDKAGIDVILVGDSASNVMAGNETTVSITLDQMIYHAQCVRKAIERSLMVVDLPFGSYQSNSDIALASAIRIMKESGAHAVKMEGGAEIGDSIKRIVAAGIPVMGHLGLTPQSIYKFGTYAVRAKDEAEAEKLKTDALQLEQAGCFAIVLEKIPALLANTVSKSLEIPTIGIGAGKDCDGQVLVMHDLLGINQEFKPRFIRQYLNLESLIQQAVEHYIRDVKSINFPSDSESY